MAIPRNSLLAPLTVCLRSFSRTSLDDPSLTDESVSDFRTNRLAMVSAGTEPLVASFLPVKNGSWKSSTFQRASYRLISAYWLLSSVFGRSYERAASLPRQRMVRRRSFSSVRLHLVRNRLVSLHVPSHNSALVITDRFGRMKFGPLPSQYTIC